MLFVKSGKHEPGRLGYTDTLTGLFSCAGADPLHHQARIVKFDVDALTKSSTAMPGGPNGVEQLGIRLVNPFAFGVHG